MRSLPHVFCFVVLITMCFSPIIFAQDEPDEIGSFELEGFTRNYEVYLPQNYQPNMPLVINLHGYYEDIEWYKEYTYMHEIADTAGFIIVYPGSIYPSWNTGEIPPDIFVSYNTTINDVGFISALIDTLHHDYAIDLSRVYSCGFSSGGIMAFKLAVDLRHRLAAVASVNGPAIEPFLKSSPLQPIPILFIHGTNDAFISYETPHGNLVSAKNTLDFWIESNHCPSHSDTTSLPDTDPPDGATVEKITYENCIGDSTVVHYKIVGGGHNWPGSPVDWDGEGNKCRDIDASVEILKFFKNYENPLVNIAYAKSMEMFPKYLSTQGDTLFVKANLYNPENHNLAVIAKFSGYYHSFTDSVLLYDDGMHRDGAASDNIYGGMKWISGIQEDIYELRLRSIDQSEGLTTDYYYPSHFTNLGPVRYDSFTGERGGFIDSQYDIRLSLTNENNNSIAKNVSATLVMISEDSCYTTMARKTVDFGDIEPDQTVANINNLIVQLEFDCRDKIIPLIFRVDIALEDNVFWQDTLILEIPIPTDIDNPDKKIPQTFALYQNHPNPFNPKTIINYELPTMNDVELSIYNLLGQKVATLVSEKQKAGFHQVEWDASGFASGIYYYRIEAGEFVDVKKMILLR